MTGTNFIIDPSNVDKHPMQQFALWYEEYLQTNPAEPTAVFLATADKKGVPSARMVLMKGHDKKGITFFTNYGSRKASDMKNNPRASLVFFWQKQNRQIRIFGKVTKVSTRESDEYFKTRAYESCIGAWASEQGSIIQSREELLSKMQQFRDKFPEGKPVPRPKDWGGFRLTPERVEFWQGRDNRIHDRVEYLKKGSNWKRQRLSP